MKRKAVLSLTLAAMLALSGCGSTSSTSSDSSSDTETETEEASSEDAEETTEEAEEEESSSDTVETSAATAVADENGSYYQETVEGSVLNIAVTSSVTSWNPWGAGMGGDGDGSMDGLIYQTLMTMEMEPELAYAYEIVDDTTYLFYLWDNITDSAGNSVTASDVVFSYEQGIASGNIHNMDIVEDITAVDDYTVQFTFTEALYMGDLETVVGQVFIVSQESYEASEDSMVTTPVGTGPYLLENWVADSITTFVVRDDYWAEPEQILTPEMECTIETINYQVISESSQITIALETGSVDYADTLTTEDLAFFQEGGEYEDEYHVDVLTSGLTYFLLLNCSENSVCSDPALREAIYYAVNTQAIVDSVADGMGILTHDGSNSTLSDYNPDWDLEDNYYNYNLDTAKEKLAAAGYSEGELSLTFVCGSSDLMTNMATIIQAFMIQLGIDVTIEAYDMSILSETMSDSSSWDMTIASRGSEDYVVNSWKVIDPADWSWGSSVNFIDDDYMVELLYTCRSLEGHTEENLDAFHEYTVENAYMMGLYNGYTCAVVNNKYTTYYNTQNYLIAQATTVNE